MLSWLVVKLRGIRIQLKHRTLTREAGREQKSSAVDIKPTTEAQPSSTSSTMVPVWTRLSAAMTPVEDMRTSDL